MVDEFSTSNCLLLSYKQRAETSEDEKLKNPTLYVPESPSILKSITAKSIADIASKMFGWEVKKAPVPFEGVKVGCSWQHGLERLADAIHSEQDGKYDEVAAAGTAAVITPIRSITYHTSPEETAKIEIGNGKTAGPGFFHLMSTMTGIQSGDVEDKFGWLWPAEGIAPTSV
jgi:branched-chain amino acid aminotransferase